VFGKKNNRNRPPCNRPPCFIVDLYSEPESYLTLPLKPPCIQCACSNWWPWLPLWVSNDQSNNHPSHRVCVGLTDRSLIPFFDFRRWNDHPFRLVAKHPQVLCSPTFVPRHPSEREIKTMSTTSRCFNEYDDMRWNFDKNAKKFHSLVDGDSIAVHPISIRVNFLRSNSSVTWWIIVRKTLASSDF